MWSAGECRPADVTVLNLQQMKWRITPRVQMDPRLCVIDLVFELLSNNQFPLRFFTTEAFVSPPHLLLGAALYSTGLLHPLCLNVR